MPAAPTSWLPDAVADLRALATSPCEAIARRIAPAVERISRMNGGAGASDALVRSGSTPFVRLVDAFAADLGLAGDPRTALVGRSTVLGYLYVRLQDDLVDEEALVDRASVYAMEAALAAHLDLLARAGVPVRVFAARSVLMARFAAFAARECDERGRDDGAAAERTGEKFLGMAVPLVALAALAGRHDLDDELAALIVDLGTALQMINDVLNAAEDHAAGRTTPLLRWIGASSFTRAGLIGHPAVHRALAVARAAATRAATRASALGLPHTTDVVDETGALVERTSERLLAHVLGLCA
ncbi:MAG TPA: hypothetical protein VHE35_15785 [Kofleriaceae bacterium]|nr:hypothetical protein [Kofleriaceae bacterium]